MSSLNFLTRDAGTAVSGRERIKFVGLFDDLLWAAVEQVADLRTPAGAAVARRMMRLPDWVDVAGRLDFSRNVNLFLRTGGADDMLHLPGVPDAACIGEVALNSIVTDQPDPVALAVRMAAQCQCNAWVDGADREWLADLIDAGRRTPYPDVAATPYARSLPLFADEPSVNGSYDGWAGVVDMLRRGKGLVVLSHSATDGFPSRIWAGAAGHSHSWCENTDALAYWWKHAVPDARWDMSEEGLREHTAEQVPGLRISPDNLHAPMLGNPPGITWAGAVAAWAHNIPR